MADEPLGLAVGAVKLQPYNPQWPRLFLEEKARLEQTLGSHTLDIQHIGSTSIPGLPAKPILDIGVAVASFEEARVCIAPLEQIGYHYRGELGIAGRHYFVKGDPVVTHHLHLLEITSEDWKNHLAFRDYLTHHPELAREYAELKLGLAAQRGIDREQYLAAKDPFIRRILALARS